MKSVDLYRCFVVLLLSGVVMSCGGGGGGGGGSQQQQNQQQSSPTYSLSGGVSGAAWQGVTITLSGAGSGTTLTDAGGSFSFTGLVNGTYTVTASKASYTFTPASQDTVISNANVAAINFVSQKFFSIGGTVKNGSAVGFGGVTLTLTGAGLASSLTATTDASGIYSVNSVVAGDYTITPGKASDYNAGLHSLTTYSFSPANKPVTVVTADIAGIDFVTTPSTTSAYVVSGKIITGTKFITSEPFILEGRTVTLYNSGYTILMYTATDATGNYSFAGVPNGSYTVKPGTFSTGSCPQATRYSFSPADQTIAVSGSDFTVSDFAENVARSLCVGGGTIGIAKPTDE